MRVPVVDAATMAELDRRATADFGITLPQMMEQAGSHLAAIVGAHLDGDLRDRRILVAVGPGINGGGGLVAARHLTNRGASVRVVLARPVLRMAPAARDQLATLLAMGADCCVATYDLADPALEAALDAGGRGRGRGAGLSHRRLAPRRGGPADRARWSGRADP